MKLPNNVYDVLKFIALIVLDAIGVFYKAIAGIWALPFGDEVLATCSACSVFLGAVLQISSHNYNKGDDFDE